MKPSDIFNKVASVGHIVTGLGMVGDALGGKPIPLEKGGFFAGIAKMLPGVMSSEDERRFEILLQKLDREDDMKGKNPRQVITEFSRWHFKKNCAGEMLISWWYGNEFRKFVVHLDKEGGDTNYGLDFLKWMVNTIQKEGDSPEARIRGFEKLVTELQHVPHVPEGATRHMDSIQEFLEHLFHDGKQGYRDAKAGLILHTRRVEREVATNKARPKSLLDRLIK